MSPSGLGSGLPFQVSPNLSSSASPVSQASTQVSLSPLRLPFRHARVAGHVQLSIIEQAGGIYTSASCVTSWSILSFRLVLFLFRFWPHDVDGGGVKIGLDVRGVVFLDHLDAGAAVFGDLVDVGAFHQAQTDVRVPQAVGRSRPAFAVEPEIFLVQNRLEKLALPFRKNEVCRLRKAPFFGAVVQWCLAPSRPCPLRSARARTESGFQSLKRAHSAAHALAVADTALAAHLDFKDRLTARVVFNDCHVPELKAPRFIGPEAGVGREQHVIVKLFAFPFEARLLGLMRAFSRGLVELLVFLGREPRPVRDFRG